MIYNNNFKTTRIEARFIIDIENKEVPLLELLSNALIYTTKKYNTRKDFINKTKDLYDTIVAGNIKNDGNRISLVLSLSFLDNKYSTDNLLSEVIDFLHEIIFNPNIVDNKFDKESFEAIKLSVNSNLETIIEDKSRYSRLRLFEILNEDNNNYLSPVSKEYKEIIENTNEEDLSNFYNKVINNSKLNIVILGNIDFENTEKLFKDKFDNFTSKKIDIIPFKEYEKNKKVLTRFESDKSQQAKLNIACNVDSNLSKYEKEVVIQIYNLILGGFANSLFFKNIREKYSLCYYISSNYFYYENILFIRSGISKNNYDKVIELIKKEMKKVQDGKFNESLLSEAKETYISILKSTMDYPSSLISNYYDNKIDGISLFNDRFADIEKVTVDDVKNIAKKIDLNTIYMFGGDSK
jgi:predicted Zn-dependent peptidase